MTDHDLVLVVDFGAQYAQLIARRVREARVYSEIVPHTLPVADMLAMNPKAIVLSGGPSSVYADGAPGIDPAIFSAGVPVFGMCYGFQLMAKGLGGTVAATGAREYGRTPVEVTEQGTLLADLPAQHKVWMSHGDQVTAAPEGFSVLATTAVTPVAAFEQVERGFAGVQWHPEVIHTEHGQQVLEHFLHEIAGCRQTWTMLNIVEEQVERIREQIGEGLVRAHHELVGIVGGLGVHRTLIGLAELGRRGDPFHPTALATGDVLDQVADGQRADRRGRARLLVGQAERDRVERVLLRGQILLESVALVGDRRG